MHISGHIWVALLTLSGACALVSCSPKTLALSALDSDSGQAFDDWDSWKDHPRQTILPWVDREIPTAVHFFDTFDSIAGWDAAFANEYAQLLIEATNRHFRANAKMNLPEGNTTEVLDAKVKLKLQSENVIQHYTGKDAYFIKKGPKANRSDRKMIPKYATDEGNMLNIFIMPFDPAEIASGAQRVESTGIALGATIKLAGLYEQGKPAWDYAGLLAHEVGHVLGLRHSWSGQDGCEDTPDNDNCWNTSTTPPCDGITSNNLMDYNVTKAAITPCQIATMHINMSNPVSRGSQISTPLDCISTTETWIIEGRQKWDKAVTIPGNIEIRKGGSLYISSYLSLPSNGKIIIRKGGTLLLDKPLIAPRCEEDNIELILHKGGKVYSRERTTILTGNPLH